MRKDKTTNGEHEHHEPDDVVERIVVLEKYERAHVAKLLADQEIALAEAKQAARDMAAATRKDLKTLQAEVTRLAKEVSTGNRVVLEKRQLELMTGNGEPEPAPEPMSTPVPKGKTKRKAARA